MFILAPDTGLIVMVIQIHPITKLPMIKPGDDLAQLIYDATIGTDTLRDGDILVITHKVVSKAEGRLVDLSSVEPSQAALNYSAQTGKDPNVVEIVLRESRAVRRMAPGVLITETRQGFVCANSGIDKSNVAGTETYALLPVDPDQSAKRIRDRLKELGGIDVAVIISDTHGRAHRSGEVNVAIGASGLNVLRDRRGERDLFGYELRVKNIAVADELAGAAELVIGQADEGVPAAVIRGYTYRRDESSKAVDLVWPRDKDLFP
jgi:coenzyme F420-0:L-glutamate ligase/coenzyme F420-1:gamma-L-glutamate ligase